MSTPLLHKYQKRRLMLTLPSSTNNSCNQLPKLISDVVPHILQFCDAKTLSRCACVSRSWRTLANNNELWSELCKVRFGVLPTQLVPPPDPTRILYMMSHISLRETLSLGSNNARGGLGSRWNNNMIQVPVSLRR